MTDETQPQSLEHGVSRPTVEHPNLPARESQRLSQAIVFSTLVAAGVSIFAVVTSSGIDWFIPLVGFGLAVFVAWARFFAD